MRAIRGVPIEQYFLDFIALLEREFWQEIMREEEARRMPYLTTIEGIVLEERCEETFWMAIELFLRFKFGAEESEFFAEVSQIQAVEILQEILTTLPELETLNDLRQRLNSEEEE